MGKKPLPLRIIGGVSSVIGWVLLIWQGPAVIDAIPADKERWVVVLSHVFILSFVPLRRPKYVEGSTIASPPKIHDWNVDDLALYLMRESTAAGMQPIQVQKRLEQDAADGEIVVWAEINYGNPLVPIPKDVFLHEPIRELNLHLAFRKHVLDPSAKPLPDNVRVGNARRITFTSSEIRVLWPSAASEQPTLSKAQRYHEKRSNLFNACRKELAHRIAFSNLNPRMFHGVQSAEDTRNWLRRSEVLMEMEKYLQIGDMPDGTTKEQLNWLVDKLNEADPDEKLP